MKRRNYHLTIVVFFIVAVINSSQIARISLANLENKADLIVLAEVLDVTQKQNSDIVTIQVDSYLKGSNSKNIYSFSLITRGGLKDFDPALKKGQTGVFFLKNKEQTTNVEKAYWGSIAIFPKNNFFAEKSDHKEQSTIQTKPFPIKDFHQQHIIFEDSNFKFARITPKANNKLSPALLVFSKEKQQWLQINGITNRKAVLGQNPTLKECRKIDKTPPAAGWDFRTLKDLDFIPIPIPYNNFYAFPDKISLNKKNDMWIFYFMSNWEIEKAQTILKFKNEDLQKAFIKSKKNYLISRKNNPVSDKINFYLKKWKNYRLRMENIKLVNLKQYEQGFRRGFYHPPGLVDGSPDFNLGHSDGMQAKQGLLPDIKK